MRRRRWTLAALILSLAVLNSACLDELGEIFEIIAFAESDDPELRELSERTAEWRAAEEAEEAIDDWFATGDPAHLDAALRLRPDDAEVLSYAVIQARWSGDPEAILSTENALAHNIARALGINDAERINRAVNGNLFVAQQRTLTGGAYSTTPWDPPGPDAPPHLQQTFEDYCEHANFLVEESGPIDYVYIPPCPD